ncbi:DUF1254 domain-containing protein [Rhizobium sp. BK251]|uniref:DUF1254 domain-containing protein n=1 Tax=Rhizobium sp. BK251 TaxID=2512125 RepID=UPI0010E43FC2|nr:DUF1254 domain-containing protein [Rhizobium sp. BK251]TCL72246.1 uncharacterized protein DUF1254 [Rhizobium sp. BK251]
MRKTLIAIVLGAVLGATAGLPANAEDLSPSLLWGRAMPPGPDARVKITEPYARMVARDAYFWAWPMLNIYNKRLGFGQAPEPGLLDGILPFAPVNRLAMLTDYIDPAERAVACPNQDVAYGGGPLGLDVSPVVIQVPDFGDRFWVYQIVDLRTDSFASLGKMYGTTPGFYLLVGPNWHGNVPKGITRVFRSTTNTGFVAPRVFVDDTPDDKRAAQGAISGIDMYPLAEFDGTMKRHDWSKLPKFPSPGSGGGAETKWVFPDKFIDQLPLVLADAQPLPGEEARYAQMLAVVEATKMDPALKKAVIDEATRSRPCFSSATGDCGCRIIGAPPPTTPPSGPTRSPALRSPSPTSSSTRRSKPSISIRTSTLRARGSTAPTAIQ